MSTNQNTPNPKKGENTAPKSNEASTKEAEVKNPLGSLKPTPVIEPTPEEKAKNERMFLELQVEDNLSDIHALTQLSKQYITTDNTLGKLKEFEFGLEDEENYGASLTITDSKRRDFTTKNPRLIQALVGKLHILLEEKKTEVAEEIAKVKISL